MTRLERRIKELAVREHAVLSAFDFAPDVYRSKKWYRLVRKRWAARAKARLRGEIDD